MFAVGVPAQPVDATQALNFSAGFQITRSHVVVRLADEPLCSDRLASAPTGRYPSESQQAIGVLIGPALPRALRIAKIHVDFSRQCNRRLSVSSFPRSQV